MYTQTDSVAQLHYSNLANVQEASKLLSSDTLIATGTFAGMGATASDAFVVAFQQTEQLDLHKLGEVAKPKKRKSFHIKGRLLAAHADYLFIEADTAKLLGIPFPENEQNKVLLLVNDTDRQINYLQLQHPFRIKFAALAVRGSEIYVLTRQQAGNRAVIFGTDNTFSRINKWGE